MTFEVKYGIIDEVGKCCKHFPTSTCQPDSSRLKAQQVYHVVLSPALKSEGNFVPNQLSFGFASEPTQSYRRCAACKKWFPSSNFYNSGSRFLSYCKNCQNIKTKQSKARIQARTAVTDFTMFADLPVKCKKCKQLLPRSAFSSRSENISGLERYCRKCIATHYRKSPDYYVINALNHRAARLGIPGTIALEEWIELKAGYGNRCAYCGVSGDSFKLVADHIFPLSLWNKDLEVSKFATNELTNIVPACEMCNFAKWNKSMIIFLGWKNGMIE